MQKRSSMVFQEYVENALEKFGEISKLANADTVSPQSVNRALAEYTQASLGLIAEYQRVKMELLDLEEDYKRWYDECFDEAKKAVRTEILESGSKTKPSLKETEIKLRNLYRRDYTIWAERLKVADAKVRFMLRMLDTYRKFDSILVTLSSNMRSEMQNLSLAERMGKVSTELKVRRFPANTMSEQVEES